MLRIKLGILGMLFFSNTVLADTINCQNVNSKTRVHFYAVFTEGSQRIQHFEFAINSNELHITSVPYDESDITMKPEYGDNIVYSFSDENCISWFVLPNSFTKLKETELVFRIRCGGHYSGIGVNVDQPLSCKINK